MTEISARSILPLAAGAVLLCLVVIACSCNRPGRVEAESPARADIPTVAVAKASTQELSRSLALTAEFKPFQEIDVMAKVAGYVKEIKVDVGDRVKQGQLLATLEIPEMVDDLARAHAAVQRSSAEVARAHDEISRAESAHEISHLSYERLAGRVSAADMRALNYAADVEHRDVAEIVREFLGRIH